MEADLTLIKPRHYTEIDDTDKPVSGNHLLAHYDEHSVVLYQTFCPEIADFAVENGYFGGAAFRLDRETFLKTSFLWTMNNSVWGSVRGKERVLAIIMEREHFESILEIASSGTMYQTPPGKVVSESVRLLWKPDCNHVGCQMERNTLLIGLCGDMLKMFNEQFIDVIKDITDFVKQQHKHVLSEDLTNFLVPEEKRLVPGNTEVCRRIMLDGFYEVPEKKMLESIIALEKLKTNHATKYNTNAMLFFQGSFNPVHCNHIQTMIECKKWLENNTKMNIVAGVMAVNSDKRLSKKFEDGVDLKIKLEHRVNMCKLATTSHPWIHTYTLLTDNTNAKDIRRDMQLQFGRTVQWLHVYGADRAIKIINTCSASFCSSVLIGRQGAMDDLKVAINAAGKKGIDINNIYIIPMTLEDVSSTGIRAKFKPMSCKNSKEEKMGVFNDLSERGWLQESVANYLVDNESDLYMYT